MRPLILFLSCLTVLTITAATLAQVDPQDRPVGEVRIEGLKRVPDQLVRNQIRMKPGMPYNPETVKEDITRITYLGRFDSVLAKVEQREDGSLTLIYQVGELPILADVQVVGNKHLTDQELLGEVQLRAGDGIEDFTIDRGAKRIVRAYEKEGYFAASVQVDQKLLNENGILLYQIREGPMVRIRRIAFEGNSVFTDKQLRSKIKSNTYIFIFRRGDLSRSELEDDAGRLRDFYRDRGYLEAQVGRRIDLSPDQRDATVTFLISEGPQFTVDSITYEGNEQVSDAQLAQVMFLKPGDVFSYDRKRRTQENLENYYGSVGYLNISIRVDQIFHENEPKVDLLVTISEGKPSVVGNVAILGNSLTKDRVIARQIHGMTPNRRFDASGIKRTEAALTNSALFSEAKVTVLGEPGDKTRDVQVQVKEKNTGSLSFGAGVSSDSGLVGAVDLVQRNFDIADLPESFDEFIRGRAFRGAGQYFAIKLQPGQDTSQYSMTFREPYLLDTGYFLDTTGFFFERERDKYDEQRLGGAFGIGQRFGDIWSASVRTRYENIDISNIDVDAPIDVFDVAGKSTLTSFGLSVTRSTVDSRIFPTRGSRIELGVQRYGALGGDYDFTRLSAEYRNYWTVDEDFFGRRTVVSLRVEMGYIFEENQAPVFERFYAGGHRSFRGFAYRGVGPRGIRADTRRKGDDPVGGDWLFLAGLEYNFPIYQEVIRGVFFVDSGTVTDQPGFTNYRLSAGTGIRLKVPFLGQAPFAFDFAIPIVREDEDDEQVFSFDIAIPF